MNISGNVYTNHVKAMERAEKLMATIRGMYTELEPIESAKRAYCDGVITREEWKHIKERYGK